VHSMGESGADESAARPDERDAAVATILAELAAIFHEYERPDWARALDADRMRLLAGADDVYAVLRYRLAGREGLSEVSVGFGDRPLNARLDELRGELRTLIAEPEPVLTAPTPPHFGERIDREPAPERARAFIAADYPRGAVIRDADGRFLRSTWSVLEHDRSGRLRPVARVWRHSVPVSTEEYRSIRAACIGWWATMAALPTLVIVAGVGGLQIDHWLLLLFLSALLLPAAAVMVGVTERRRSSVVALYSEKTGELVTPVSRGSQLHMLDDVSDADRALQNETRMLRRIASETRAGRPPSAWVVFLSCADGSGAESLAMAGVGAGWELQYAGPEPSGTRWMIILERDVTALSAQAVHDARAYFEALAATVADGMYDGWQAEH
jgi:hypothetical protein